LQKTTYLEHALSCDGKRGFVRAQLQR
jgi:hypothetical protein